LVYHGISTESSISGDNLKVVIGRLEGFEAPLGAWEHDLLPARVNYDPDELERLITGGDVVWGRLNPPEMTEESRGKILTRATPIALIQREDLNWLLPLERKISIGVARWDAQAAYDALKHNGALFFSDLLAVTKLLPSQLDSALRELAALGAVTSDGFAAIRAVSTKSKHGLGRSRRKSRSRANDISSRGGRWSLFPPFHSKVETDGRTEKWAWQLLKRYGVVFRDLLVRESLSPRWSELSRIYRRLEMRGEIRGGRFVHGVCGEQFALPEVVEQVRSLRADPAKDCWAVISAVDPLNLVGVLTKDMRVSAQRGNRLVLLNGRAIAARESCQTRWLTDVNDELRNRAEQLLLQPGQLGHGAAINRRQIRDPEFMDASVIAKRIVRRSGIGPAAV
ncbi:MAG TPA: DEAD/DEAH box helicase, partial [Lacipirellulaceae bacterium]|nr:DEAD/DEAH box helicase [Lacipirellulaceae bacterium]